ncbi:MAG TPA: CPBP family intramembrane glutamic endopeptidase, partial [Methanomicrobiales archaeon]|nr:CPBP family intramembrane glutamic endopeptidase [Methanomicrobiales archaeon]
ADLSIGAYLLGLFVILGTAYSQYLVKYGPLVDFIVIYGIPAAVVSYLWGRSILRRSTDHNRTAFEYGLGYFALFTAIGLFFSIVILLILLAIDPSTLVLLQKPNPVMNVSPERAWIMVGASFLVVGPAEEYLYRGFVYGGLLKIFHRHHWLVLGLVSELIFAAAHLYYGFTYGPVSGVMFASLIAFGMAMAATYYISGGNLLAPVIIHGAYDATGFLGVATGSIPLLLVLRGALFAIGLGFALYLFFGKNKRRD